MQTFFPLHTSVKSATVLDSQRLLNQVHEGIMIYNIIQQDHSNHHPAVLMWTGFDKYLMIYLHAMLCEIGNRNLTIKYHSYITELSYPIVQNYYTTPLSDRSNVFPQPPFVGCAEFHASHRRALLFKNKKYYQTHFPYDVPAYDYYWPIRIAKNTIILRDVTYLNAYAHVISKYPKLPIVISMV